MRALGAEIQPDAILAAERARGVGLLGLRRPAREFGEDIALDDAGPRFPPNLPKLAPSIPLAMAASIGPQTTSQPATVATFSPA